MYGDRYDRHARQLRTEELRRLSRLAAAQLKTILSRIVAGFRYGAGRNNKEKTTCQGLGPPCLAKKANVRCIESSVIALS